MPELRVESVDPRDQGWELWEPTYRVYFWRRFDGGWASRELEVSGGDVVSTLEWATEQASGAETYQVFCVVPAAHGIGHNSARHPSDGHSVDTWEARPGL